MTDPAICVLLTTYKRTEYAVRTIEAVKKNLQWPQVWWYISDDGSPPEHTHLLQQAIGSSYNIRVFNSNRQGVGYGMNMCLSDIFASTDLVLVLEDDWELVSPLDLRPYVNLLMNQATYGMVRFGYLSAGLTGTTVSEEGRLFWKLTSSNDQYRFTGHPGLRHKRFHEIYGYYDEGLAPGNTELSMCGKVNAKIDGPAILYPAECGAWGFFGHIGTESLANLEPTQ